MKQCLCQQYESKKNLQRFVWIDTEYKERSLVVALTLLIPIFQTSFALRCNTGQQIQHFIFEAKWNIMVKNFLAQNNNIVAEFKYFLSPVLHKLDANALIETQRSINEVSLVIYIEPVKLGKYQLYGKKSNSCFV